MKFIGFSVFNETHIDRLSVRSMMGQIAAHEEHTVEYTDRIAAMEEELKKVRLFL